MHSRKGTAVTFKQESSDNNSEGSYVEVALMSKTSSRFKVDVRGEECSRKLRQTRATLYETPFS